MERGRTLAFHHERNRSSDVDSKARPRDGPDGARPDARAPGQGRSSTDRGADRDARRPDVRVHVHPAARRPLRRERSEVTLVAGTKLGSYEVIGPLGAGGMGEVYRARDAKLDRDVAIKVLPERLSSDPDALARFEREAKTVAALSHPNLLGIYDFGVHDGVTYAVTELLAGETLRDKLSGGPIPRRKAIEYALQIARGLAAAHEHGVAHRDLKPENVFVTNDGRVKILDFGLARQTAAALAGGGDATIAPAVDR